MIRIRKEIMFIIINIATLNTIFVFRKFRVNNFIKLNRIKISLFV